MRVIKLREYLNQEKLEHWDPTDVRIEFLDVIGQTIQVESLGFSERKSYGKYGDYDVVADVVGDKVLTVFVVTPDLFDEFELRNGEPVVRWLNAPILKDFLFAHFDDYIQLTKNGHVIYDIAIKFTPLWVLQLYGNCRCSYKERDSWTGFKYKIWDVEI